MSGCCIGVRFFFFNDTATTEIYTLSLHDALPIWRVRHRGGAPAGRCAAELGLHPRRWHAGDGAAGDGQPEPEGKRPDAQPRPRSEEHTSELQSRQYLVCRLLLEKKTDDRRDDDLS